MVRIKENEGKSARGPVSAHLGHGVSSAGSEGADLQRPDPSAEGDLGSQPTVEGTDGAAREGQPGAEEPEPAAGEHPRPGGTPPCPCLLSGCSKGTWRISDSGSDLHCQGTLSPSPTYSPGTLSPHPPVCWASPVGSALSALLDVPHLLLQGVLPKDPSSQPCLQKQLCSVLRGCGLGVGQQTPALPCPSCVPGAPPHLHCRHPWVGAIHWSPSQPPPAVHAGWGLSARTHSPTPSPQLKARCEELKLDWSTLSLENLLKEKQALKSQISEKQRHCLELQVRLGWGLEPSSLPLSPLPGSPTETPSPRLQLPAPDPGTLLRDL